MKFTVSTLVFLFAILVSAAFGGNNEAVVMKCDSLASELYVYERTIAQVEACTCVGKYEFKKVINAKCELLSEAKRCDSLDTRVRALELRIKQVKAQLN